MRMNEAGREVHGFRCKLATYKGQEELHMVHENNPGAACMDGIERTERKTVYRETLRASLQLKPAKLLCEWLQWLHILFRPRADSGFSVRFENTASRIQYKCSTTLLARAKSCLLACVVAR